MPTRRTQASTRVPTATRMTSMNSRARPRVVARLAQCGWRCRSSRQQCHGVRCAPKQQLLALPFDHMNACLLRQGGPPQGRGPGGVACARPRPSGAWPQARNPASADEDEACASHDSQEQRSPCDGRARVAGRSVPPQWNLGKLNSRRGRGWGRGWVRRLCVRSRLGATERQG
jgi:hypothetical protein